MRSAIVPILAQFDHQHPWIPPLITGELGHILLDGSEFSIAIVGRAVHAAQRTHLRTVASVDRLERAGYLAHGSTSSRRSNAGGQ